MWAPQRLFDPGSCTSEDSIENRLWLPEEPSHHAARGSSEVGQLVPIGDKSTVPTRAVPSRRTISLELLSDLKFSEISGQLAIIKREKKLADYRDMLRRAIDELPEINGNSRRRVYDKARDALRKQLDTIVPELTSREKTSHRLRLEESIRDVEHDFTEHMLSRILDSSKFNDSNVHISPIKELNDILISNSNFDKKIELDNATERPSAADIDTAADDYLSISKSVHQDTEAVKTKLTRKLTVVSSSGLPPEALEFEAKDGRYRIAIGTSDSDLAVARRKSFRADLADLQKKSILLCSLVDGTEEWPEWEGLADASNKISKLLAQRPVDVARSISRIWSALVSLGSFLEQDDRIVGQGRNTNTPCLSDSTRRALQDLVRTAAPLVREFPTARRKDDEAGAFLKEISGFRAAQRVFDAAQEKNLLEDETQVLIRQLIEAVERGDFQGTKAKRTTVGSAQALIRKTIEYTLAAYVSATFSIADLPEVQASAELLLSSRNQIVEIFSHSPEDLKIAINDLMDELENAALPSGGGRREEDDEEGTFF